MRTVRWGMIGCGAVTEVKSGPALRKAEGSSLAAVMCRTAARAEDYARRHGVPRWCTDARQLVDDPGVDAVYVATPPSTHMEYTLLAAAAGKPVYVEKPMARTHEECERMIRACRASRGGAGVPLFVAYYRRRLPRFLAIKRLVDSGALGEVRFVSVCHYHRPNPKELDRANPHWRVVPDIAGAGRFLDIAPHALDFLDLLLGPIGEVSGVAANQAGLYEAEEVVVGHWRHAGGALGAGTWCFTAFDRVDRVEVVGSRGTLAFAVLDTTPARLWTSGGVEDIEVETPEHVQQPLIQSIVDELRGVTRDGQTRCPSTGESAARTSRVADELLRTWRERSRGSHSWIR
jgi:1,5-anhydro-D-fructose reductase (1,5-anhydro-D-mannitol-forming)